MADSESSEGNSSASPTTASKKDQPEEVPLIVRRYYDSLCKLIEAADPQYVSNKLYAKGIVGSAAHRDLEALGVSKRQKSESVVDAFMKHLEGMAEREKQLSTLETFLGILANINSPCKQVATEIATAAGCPQPVTSLSPPMSPIVADVAQPTTSSASARGLSAKDLREDKILDVLRERGFSNPDWKKLGSALGLSPSQLDSIAADKRADNTAGLSNALINMLSMWMRRDVDSSWGKLAEALAKLGETTLSDKAGKQQGELTVNSIHHLLNEEDFDESNWFVLGTNLSLSTSRLKGIEATHLGNLSGAQIRALIAVLSTWLKQDLNAKWDKLAEALKEIGYPKIAAAICP